MKWGKLGRLDMSETENIGTPPKYVGEFFHNLDPRNRVTIPSTWRVEGDEQNYYMAWPHPDGCIAVYPPAMQKRFLALAEDTKQSDTKGQQLLRRFFGKAVQFGCDKQGRVLLPESLIKHAAIDKELVLVGLGNNFQVWGAERYTKVNDDDFNLLEAMRDLGL
ncbi:MAG: hypothetical protein SFY80_04410 [Verrucomicrobiota bacterium]|nr:hypothetical protein [Verrucomicrobiota bacterium]